MNGDEIDILLKIGNRFFEGKLHPQKIGGQVPEAKRPMFPEPYAEMLTITDMDQCWEIKPKTFLATDDFVEICRIVKQYKGEYVSAGKSSHFTVPK